jgi:hypothetical protein
VGREEELAWGRVVVAEDLELVVVARGAAVGGHDSVDGLDLARRPHLFILIKRWWLDAADPLPPPCWRYAQEAITKWLL